LTTLKDYLEDSTILNQPWR